MTEARCPTCGHPLRDHIDPVALGAALPFSRLERRVFDRLASHFGIWVRNERLIDAAYADQLDGGPEAARLAIASILKGLRRKIRPYGLEVEWLAGRGDGERRLNWKAPA